VLTPEEKHSHFIGNAEYERDDDLPDVRPAKVRKTRDVNIDLDENRVETVEEEVQAMRLFQETEHGTRVLKQFSDQNGWDGILEEDRTFYQVNYTEPRPDLGREEGEFIQKREISEEEVVEFLENHFQEFKLGRSLRPL
jgi:hypothetical protein